MTARCVAPLLALILAAPAADLLAAEADANASSAPSATPAPNPNRCRIETMTIPVRLVEQRPVATVKINGTPVPLLVDSGAFFSFLSHASAKQLELKTRPVPDNLRVYGITGRVEDLKVAKVAKLELEGAVIPNADFIVGGSEVNAGIMGILGRNILSAGDTEYDLAHGVIRLVFPRGDCEKTTLAYWAGEAPVIEAPLVNYGRNDSSIRVPTLVNGQKVVALMDTGAPTTTLMFGAARRAGIAEADMRLIGRGGGAGSQLSRRWSAKVERFEIGGEKVSNNDFRIAEANDDDHGMLLGLDYFLAHRVYVSRLQGKMYATWNGGPVFAKGKAPAEAYDQRYAAKAEEIAEDDAEGLARRGNASLVSGNPAKALEDLDKAVRLQPTAINFESRARVNVALKKPKEALADLDEALKLDPKMIEARLHRVSLRMGVGNRDGAAADLAELDASLAPTANQRLQMATLFVRRSELPQAIKQYDLWIPTHQRDNDLAGALGMRCWLRARMNVELDKAVSDCKDAIDEDGEEPMYRTYLGWARLRKGDASDARRDFDRSLEKRKQPWGLYGRGLTLMKLGETEKGQQDLEAARKLMPTIDETLKRIGFEGLMTASAPAQ